ncbi:oxysterol-binding protein-related protein 9 isoform X2 [Anopheles bellator]|uniref:oxysterol-binding protein-related protein 9 isoform X2 n=1 Tax=Anopheles bellator TaxID=139047 RepID=UPI002647E275|nr:oxysterol-binding protein-related protein 9 isoform X2 [Anopheles bellator]
MAMLEGTLSKWTNVMKGWQYRWFVLDEYAGLLSYYTSKEKMMKGVRRGCVRLKGAIIGIDDQDVNTFTITVDHKTFHFQARDADEREKWVRRLEDTILRHANRGRGLWDSQCGASGALSVSAGGSGHGSAAGGATGTMGVGTGGASARRSNNLVLFDRKVTEADAFLQLMIEQTTKIDARLEALGEADAEEASCLKTINEHANAMLDNIKHSIVLLQITKNTANPINGIYQGPVSSKSETETETSDSGLATVGVLSSSLTTDIEVADECRESVRRANIASISVPETSYSSSEGEDDFFDANDDPFTSSQLNTPTSNTRTLSEHTARLSVEDNYVTAEDNTSGAGSLKKQDSILEPTSISSSGGTTSGHDTGSGYGAGLHRVARKSYDSKSLPIRTDGSLDYDALYEDESDNDLSMESHGSVVTHLLSQVKIGMDLTKVVLPTFILERRSLLEMYADYFAHPDLFLRIADMNDTRERMIQVVRWYLSAYHAGRKSSVAKKPYNPILGEIFQCHWDTPELPTGDEASNVEVQDGPVPWCRRDQLTFIAEQVSHHPPISAFYAEHYNKKISFSAHVWTKSKFLGLSIGVHNIGQGTVTLCDLNEEYVVTFPNGYGRSILTIPWIELGGTVTITCPQSGYRADIDFLTKPFYGGKKNRIQGEIYGPNDKKSFLSISGEWSGLMEYKFNDGSKPSKFETFVDVNSIPIFKKKVRPVGEQQEHESRKVWREVTAGLKMNDIEKATNAKFQVEQKQREEAKERKETFGEWETKYFKGVNGESWIYSNPLLHRLTLEKRDSKR